MTYEEVVRSEGSVALEQVERFLMHAGPVYETLHRITARLRELNIPHAVAGGMAIVAHGYPRTTEDVDILLTADGLKQTHAALEGLGYTAAFTGSKNLRDASSKVKIEFLVTGQFPGDGKPKPLAFPNPADVSHEIDGISYLRLPALIDLKLASGLTGGVARLKDFADVVELIKALHLDIGFAQQLDPYVREKFTELVEGVKNSPSIEGESE